MQPGNFHDLLHMQNNSCKAVSGAVATWGLAQTDVLVHVNGTYIGQVIISWFFSNFT